jgi:hypothetical protein
MSAEIKFFPVSSLEDLQSLNEDDIVQGYLEYYHEHQEGKSEPPLHRGRAYWHGWCNRRRDMSHAPPTKASSRLVHLVVQAHRERLNSLPLI